MLRLLIFQALRQQLGLGRCHVFRRAAVFELVRSVDSEQRFRRVKSAPLAHGGISQLHLGLIIPKRRAFHRAVVIAAPGVAQFAERFAGVLVRGIFVLERAPYDASPIVALSTEISWGWLAALLVCAVGFGAASFTLRSRSLLTVSTAALLTDLGFIVFRIGTTAPTVLWVLGLVFGLALMAVAAWLEHQREGVLQQIRLFGRELRAWS